MKLTVRHAQGELVVPSQKEFLQLLQSGIIAPDDEVQREGRGPWVKAKDLPWIRGTALQDKKDDRRLFFISVLLMVAGLAAIFWLQARYGGQGKGQRPAAQQKR
jgi:hypothetical protein